MNFFKKHIVPVIVYFTVAGAVTYMTGQFDLNQLLLSGILFFVFYNVFNKVMLYYKTKQTSHVQKDKGENVEFSSKQPKKKKKKKRSKKKNKKKK